MSLKKIFNGKKFSKFIFLCWNTFWTIIKRFRPIFFFEKFSISLVIFCHFLAQKRFFNFWGRNFKMFFSSISKGLYCGHFALLYASLVQKLCPCALMRGNFLENGPKIQVFGDFPGRKNQKNDFLLPDHLKDFIAVLLSYHTHLYVKCGLRAHGCAFLTAPPPPDSRWLIECGGPD